ncbi:hypothetical protein [Calothrix sp. 336/3]|uniref:hypothetical protein n=1 Tax=Calothrix sp. 336/3 TaxID=1337936 RepID=UPI0004E3EBB7|nr:hypothetical protein [Calothrix sp. 336/3]AKG20548.1 hypothetical protein IJ00_03750 [Calothrix sp. 336/3]
MSLVQLIETGWEVFALLATALLAIIFCFVILFTKEVTAMLDAYFVRFVCYCHLLIGYVFGIFELPTKILLKLSKLFFGSFFGAIAPRTAFS